MGEFPSLAWDSLNELDQLTSRLIVSGRIAELALILERAFPTDQASWEQIDKLASTKLQLGYPDRARELWSQAPTPSRAGLRQSRIAVTYLAKGDLDTARKSFLAAIEATPDLFEAHYGLAVLEQDAGNANEARDHALMAMDLSPKDDAIRFSAARGIAGRVDRFTTTQPARPALKLNAPARTSK
jgi:tetratricopeptide (TPR) repeat protein